MGKYSGAEQAVFDVLDSALWKAEDIKTFPTGFDGEMGAPPFIRVTLVYSGPSITASNASGVMNIEIFTAWGLGPRPSSEIADTLDKYFQHITYGTTQFFNSNLGGFIKDRDNSGLGRAIYSVPFSHFGV